MRAAADAASPAYQADVAAIQAALLRADRSPRSATRRYVAAALACAAAALLALSVEWLRPTEQARNVTAPATACALPTALALTGRESDGQRLTLGRFGELVTSAGSRVLIESAEPCALTLQLERGTLAGDLNSLRPATLRVRTAHGSVVVRGTRFSIRADDALEVVLLTGRVDVEDGRTESLEPAHVLRKQGKSRKVTPVQPADAEVIARLLRKPAARAAQTSAPSPAEASATSGPDAREVARAQPTASELLSRAEAERKRGRLGQARALYRAASALSGDDAEVALLRWVRLELDARSYESAELLLQRHVRAFAEGKLRAESAWLRVVLLNARGAHDDALRAARELLTRFPHAPQADAARALLERP